MDEVREFIETKSFFKDDVSVCLTKENALTALDMLEANHQKQIEELKKQRDEYQKYWLDCVEKLNVIKFVLK